MQKQKLVSVVGSVVMLLSCCFNAIAVLLYNLTISNNVSPVMVDY